MNKKAPSVPGWGLPRGEGFASLAVLATKLGENPTICGVNVNPKTIPQVYIACRSFYAVGKSCVINLNPTQSQSGPTPRPLNLVTAIGTEQCSHHAKKAPTTSGFVLTKAVGRGDAMPGGYICQI